jgi:NAD(P)-dependent dehydrogenase (short-subunit alcohol dehydrogenase family)
LKDDDMGEFEGKVAVVTGASTLIGACVVEALSAAGASVVMADIAEDDGGKIAARLGDGVAFLRTDVTSDADIDACLALAEARYGGVDCLVNVACTYLDGGIETTREQWLSGLNVNLVGMAVFATKAAPFMRRRGGGAIVNYGSISGKVAQGGHPAHDEGASRRSRQGQDPGQFGLSGLDLVERHQFSVERPP